MNLDFNKIRENRRFRIVLIFMDLTALLCVGYGKSYSGHTSGTVIDPAFLETVRQIVVHERFALFGTISAACFLITTLLVFLPDFTELNPFKVKWGCLISWTLGMCMIGYLLVDAVPILYKPLSVSCEEQIVDVTRSGQDSNKQALVNSSDRMVRDVDKETPAEAAQFYAIYCNGKIIRMYHIGKYSLSDDVK